MRFDNYLKNNDAISLIEIGMFFDDNMLNEGQWTDKLKGALKSVGFKAHKSGPGLIQIISSAGKHIAKLMWYSFKAAKGDEEAKKMVKEIAKKEIQKGELVDFLLKLDTLTLHLLTGPLHMIEALTGWHIWSDIKKSTKDLKKRAEDALEQLKNISTGLAGKAKDALLNYIGKIKSLISMQTGEV